MTHRSADSGLNASQFHKRRNSKLRNTTVRKWDENKRITAFPRWKKWSRRTVLFWWSWTRHPSKGGRLIWGHLTYYHTPIQLTFLRLPHCITSRHQDGCQGCWFVALLCSLMQDKRWLQHRYPLCNTVSVAMPAYRIQIQSAICCFWLCRYLTGSFETTMHLRFNKLASSNAAGARAHETEFKKSNLVPFYFPSKSNYQTGLGIYF